MCLSCEMHLFPEKLVLVEAIIAELLLYYNKLFLF